MPNLREPIDHAFNFKKLNAFFAVSSILMFLFFVAAVMYDHTREWKRVQLAWRELEIGRTRAGIEEAEKKVDAARRTEAEAKLKEGEAKIAGQEQALGAVEGELAGIRSEIYKADQKVRFTKALLDAEKYSFEEAAAHGQGKAGPLEKRWSLSRTSFARRCCDSRS
jgi:hypothetical protein